MTASPTFDPYAEWLQVPPGPRPPDHYALLGIAQAEADSATIQAAARERYQRVRKYQLKWPVLATQLLGEISRAEICLRDPVSRAEYDQSFCAPRLSPVPEQKPPVPADSGSPHETTSHPGLASPPREPIAATTPSGSETEPARMRTFAPGRPTLLVCGLILVAVVGLGVYVSSDPSKPPSRTQTTHQKAEDKEPEHEPPAPPSPPAVFELLVNPPTAEITVKSGVATVTGSGRPRVLEVSRPNANSSVVLVVRADRHDAKTVTIPINPGLALPIPIELTSLAARHFDSASQAVKDGRFDVALRELSAGLKLDPDHVPSLVLRSEVLYRKGGKAEWAEALEGCNRVLALAKSHSGAAAIRAAILVERGHYRDAREALQLVDPNDRGALVLAVSASLLSCDGRLVEAKKACDEALGVDPDCALALAVRAEIHRSENKSEDAGRAVERSLRIAPRGVYASVVRARLHSAAAEYLKAREVASAVLEADPNRPDALAVRAMANAGLGFHLEALKEGKRALQGGVGSADLRAELCDSLLECARVLDQPKEAIEVCDAWLKATPADDQRQRGRALVARAEVNLRRKAYSAAENDCKTGADLGAASSHLFEIWVASIQLRVGSRNPNAAGEIERVCEQWAKALPDDAGHHRWRARAELLLVNARATAKLDSLNQWSELQRRRREVIPSLENAIRRLPPKELATEYEALARIYLALEEDKEAPTKWATEAVKVCTKALEAECGRPEVFYEHRSVAYRRLDQYEQALKDLKQWVELKPDSSEACNALAWLLSTCPSESEKIRDGKQAIQYAEKSLRQLCGARNPFQNGWPAKGEPNLPRFDDPAPLVAALETLAAAHAEAAQFNTASVIQVEAWKYYGAWAQRKYPAGADPVIRDKKDRLINLDRDRYAQSIPRRERLKSPEPPPFPKSDRP